MREAKAARIVRMLIYEGPVEWVEHTLTHPERYVKGVRDLGTRDRGIRTRITEVFLAESPLMADGLPAVFDDRRDD